MVENGFATNDGTIMPKFWDQWQEWVSKMLNEAASRNQEGDE
jgi:hypothetical protein